MAARVEVLRCVTVRRVIAATDMPAAQAQPQMHPLRTDLETVLATFGRTRCYRMNLRQMFATHDPSHCIFEVVMVDPSGRRAQYGVPQRRGPLMALTVCTAPRESLVLLRFTRTP